MIVDYVETGDGIVLVLDLPGELTTRTRSYLLSENVSYATAEIKAIVRGRERYRRVGCMTECSDLLDWNDFRPLMMIWLEEDEAERDPTHLLNLLRKIQL